MTTNSFDENLSVLRICDDSNSLFCLKFKVPTYLINNNKVDDLLNEYFHYYFKKNGELTSSFSDILLFKKINERLSITGRTQF